MSETTERWMHKYSFEKSQYFLSNQDKVAKSRFTFFLKQPKTFHDTRHETTKNGEEGRWETSKVSSVSAQTYHPKTVSRTQHREAEASQSKATSHLRTGCNPKRLKEQQCAAQRNLKKGALHLAKYWPLCMWANWVQGKNYLKGWETQEAH